MRFPWLGEVRKAVQAEREACAKIIKAAVEEEREACLAEIESVVCRCKGKCCSPHHMTRRRIAERIRKRAELQEVPRG